MNAREAIAALVLICAMAIVAPAQRLSPTAVPEHYDIHLAPDFETDTFDGRVSISVQLTESTRAITLNAAEIEFHEATISAEGTARPASVSLDEEKEIATLVAPETLPSGPAVIAISYRGRLNDRLRGFYLSRANIGSTQNFCDLTSRNDVERFFSLNRVRGTERTLERAQETIDRCIETKVEQHSNLTAFLSREGTVY